jgi:hypothetical protein
VKSWRLMGSMVHWSNVLHPIDQLTIKLRQGCVLNI